MRFLIIPLAALALAAPAAAQERHDGLDALLTTQAPKPEKRAQAEPIATEFVDVGVSPVDAAKFEAQAGDGLFVGAACLMRPQGTQICSGTTVQLLSSDGQVIAEAKGSKPSLKGPAPYAGAYAVRVSARACEPGECRAIVTVQKIKMN